MRRNALIALLAASLALNVAHVLGDLGGSYATKWALAGQELSGPQMAFVTVAHAYGRYGWLLWGALLLIAAWAFLTRERKARASS